MKRVWLFFFSLFLFFSCSDDNAAINSVSSSIVCDFSDADSSGELYLAVFVQCQSSPQRADRIILKKLQSDYVWEVSSPLIFSGNSKNYVCCTKIKAPEGEYIKNGEYELTYIDAAGNEDTASFYVNYSENLIFATAEDVRDVIGNHIDETVALYDNNNNLLYYGKPKNNWKQNSRILNDYRDAVSKRVFYTTALNSIVCMMPVENLKDSQSVKTEEDEEVSDE